MEAVQISFSNMTADDRVIAFEMNLRRNSEITWRKIGSFFESQAPGSLCSLPDCLFCSPSYIFSFIFEARAGPVGL